MRLPEMLLTTVQRYVPIAKEDLAVLKGELTDKYLNIINSIKMKEEKDAPIKKEIEQIEKEIESLDPHSPDFGDKLDKIDKLTEKLSKKTIFEKAISFLEKPLVRVVLMIGFLIFSRWLIKKLTEKPKEDEPEVDDTVDNSQPFFNQGYNPYGSHPMNGGFYGPDGRWYNSQPPQQFQQQTRR